jgi:hypothetical protein
MVPVSVIAAVPVTVPVAVTGVGVASCALTGVRKANAPMVNASKSVAMGSVIRLLFM